MSDKYSNLIEVLSILRRTKIMAGLIISSNIAAIIARIFWRYFRTSDIVIIIDVTFKIMVFIFNTIAFAYYYRMGKYYKNLLITFLKDKKKFEILMWTVLSIIIISDFTDNVYISFSGLLS